MALANVCNRNKQSLLSLLLVCASVLNFNHCYAKDSIVWQSVHIPPSSIKTGPYEGQGFVQLILQQITAQLPEYEHQFPVTTIARTMKDLKAGRNVCHPTLLITEQRKQWAVFSQASLFNENNQLLVGASNAQKMTTEPVPLQSLSAYPELGYSIIKERAYGNIIDTYISTSVPMERRLNSTRDNLENIIRLVALNKVDITFAFPFDFQYFLANNPKYRDKVVIKPIANQPPYIVASVACSNTPWGKRTIQRINEALAIVKPTQAYKTAMTRWWPKDSLNQQFKDFYQDYFLNH